MIFRAVNCAASHDFRLGIAMLARRIGIDSRISRWFAGYDGLMFSGVVGSWCGPVAPSRIPQLLMQVTEEGQKRSSPADVTTVIGRIQTAGKKNNRNTQHDYHKPSRTPPKRATHAYRVKDRPNSAPATASAPASAMQFTAHLQSLTSIQAPFYKAIRLSCSHERKCFGGEDAAAGLPPALNVPCILARM
jgi:hypothetical protein